MGDAEELRPSAEAGGTSRFHFPQPNPRDLQSNWEVDLAKKLEDYLLKICSGELASDQDHELHSVNFAEAALLLQGSVQVYSRKVEYLYSLVLHSLEFLSQKRQDQQEKDCIQPDGSHSAAVVSKVNVVFIGLDDVPAEAKINLDAAFDKVQTSTHLIKPPSNFLVLEGDCLNSSGDGSELDSYLLSTCNSFGDFLLLDPCDAGAISEYLRNGTGKENTLFHRSNSIKSKTSHSALQSPAARSGGTGRNSSIGKNHFANMPQTLEDNSIPCNLEDHTIMDNDFSGLNNERDFSDHETCNVEDPIAGCSNAMDDYDDDDPWKPLNPHEPGNLKVRPFRRVKDFGRQVVHSKKLISVAQQFPVSKMDRFISLEFAEASEVQGLAERFHRSQSPPLFEKLRRTLLSGEGETYKAFYGYEDDDDGNEAEGAIPDFSQEENNLIPEAFNMDTEPNVTAAIFDGAEDFQNDLDCHTSLEDLCRLHLDALLASIAETEKQTELATRVSTWKQRIEHTLEEQDTRPPFDIHLYGNRILDKLSESGKERRIPFGDIILAQAKHEVARTFSALLQLANNRNIDLERGTTTGELVCHTSTNPFHVRLLDPDKRKGEIVNHATRKRLKSPYRKGSKKSSSQNSEATSPSKSSLEKGGSPLKLGKGSIVRCTPDRKRKRSARYVEPYDLQSAS